MSPKVHLLSRKGRWIVYKRSEALRAQVRTSILDPITSWIRLRRARADSVSDPRIVAEDRVAVTEMGWPLCIGDKFPTPSTLHNLVAHAWILEEGRVSYTFPS